MTKHLYCEGIVLKETPLGENGKLLVIFTKEYGKISVAAKGVKKPGSSLVQLAQLFAFSKLELYKGNSSLYTLTGGTLSESFYGLSSEFERLTAAGKITQAILKVIQEDLPDEETLRLLLNSLYLISNGKRAPEFVLCVFLIKMLEYQGVVPEISEIEKIWNKSFELGTYEALEHILYSEIENLFNFGVSEAVFEELKGISNMLLREIY